MTGKNRTPALPGTALYILILVLGALFLAAGCGGGGGGGATGAVPGSNPAAAPGNLEGFVFVPAGADNLVTPVKTPSPAGKEAVPGAASSPNPTPASPAPAGAIISADRIYQPPASPTPAPGSTPLQAGVIKAPPNGYMALPNAQVYLEGQTTGTTTDADGYFRLNNLTSGSRTIYICKTGYAAISRDINIPSGGTASIDATNGYVTTTTSTVPYVTTLTPASGAEGTAVVVKGVNFGAVQGAGSITFGGTPATPSSWQDDEIDATVPAGAASGSVVVTVGGQPSNARYFTVGGGKARWTFLVYLDADNNLESEGIFNLNQMEAVGSTSQVNIVVQMDRSSSYDSSNGNWTTCRRYLVSKDSNTSTISSTLVQDIGEVDMADPATLTSFVNWGVQNYPADHYMVVLWDHGSGWYRGQNKLAKAIISDDSSGKIMEMAQMRTALLNARNSLGHNLDVVGFDACLMNMGEVAYQLRGVADYMVTSEETEPGDGWPYDRILGHLTAVPTMNAQTLTGYVVSDYGAYYGSQAVTQSALNLGQMSGFLTDLNSFSQACIDNMDTARAGLQNTISGTQNYYYPDFADLYDYLARVRANVNNPAIQSAAQTLQNRIALLVTAEYHGAGSAVANSHGLAIWLPTTQSHYSSDQSFYSTLDLSTQGKWDDFLASLWSQVVPPLYRIEVTWGSQPTDLDSYLWDANGNRCYWGNTTINGAYLANDSQTPGPENTCITALYPGSSTYYDFAVNAYQGTFPANQTATVKVYQGGNASPAYTFTRTSFDNTNRWWHVLRINASNGAVTQVGTYSSAAPRTLKGVLPNKVAR